MNARDFAYWLQGLFELTNATTLDAAQTTKIRNHLAMVFLHDIDPGNMEGLDPKIRKVIEEVHSGTRSLSDIRLMC